MKTRILGTGQNGCMKNEIVLNVFDAFVIKALVTKAIKENDEEEFHGHNRKLHAYDRKHWEQFIKMFDLAFTGPSKMEENNLEELF